MFGNEAAVGLSINGHDRCETARTHATQDVEGELAVRGNPAFGDFQLVLERVENLLGTLDVASRTKADGDGILALRLHRKEAVEGDDTIHLPDRDSEAVCHNLLDFLGKIAEMLLRLVQDIDQLTRIIVEGSADFLDLQEIGFGYFNFGSNHGSKD